MAKRCARVLLILVALAAVSSEAYPRGKPSPRVVPPNARYRGFKYGEWAAKWWQAAFALPVVGGDHPLLSGGALGGENGVLFLAGVFSDPDLPVEIEITIPAGTALFFPVLNVECSVFEPDPFHGDDEEELRQCANDHMDSTSDLFALIDGSPVKKLEKHRTESPLFQWGPLPEDNFFAFFGLDAPEGTTSLAVDVGVYVLVKPLGVGTHVIEFGGTFGGELSGSINTRYTITVVPDDGA